MVLLIKGFLVQSHTSDPLAKYFYDERSRPSKYEIHNCELVRITFSLQDPLPYRYMGKGSGTLATFS